MKVYHLLITIGLAALPTQAAFMTGDVFVSAGFFSAGAYRYSSTGKFIDILGSDTQVFGSAFDKSGNFYLTTFLTFKVDKFDNGTDPPPGHIGAIGGSTFLTTRRIPVGVAFDATGNLYVAMADAGAPIPEYAPDGTLVRSLQTGSSAGTRDVQISPDQKTLYYSTGSTIKPIDLASGNLLSDFADVGGLAYEFQLLPDGGMLVANGGGIVRLDSVGQIVQTYSQAPTSENFSVALTPDKRHFWTEGYAGNLAVELDLGSGAAVASFQTPPFVTSLSVYDPASFGSDPAGPANGIPEPASLGLVALSLCGFALCRHRSA